MYMYKKNILHCPTKEAKHTTQIIPKKACIKRNLVIHMNLVRKKALGPKIMRIPLIEG